VSFNNLSSVNTFLSSVYAFSASITNSEIQNLNATTGTINVLNTPIANIDSLSSTSVSIANVNFPNAGGNLFNNASFFGNLTVHGTISALSGVAITTTTTSQTSSLSVVNTGLGPALYVRQIADLNGIAVFAGDGGTEVLRVNNTQPLGNPGINVTGTQVIEANSNFAALRVTQTGAGNALVIEDDTNPDSTPFVVNNTGVVLVNSVSAFGTASKLESHATGPFDPGLVVISDYSANNWSRLDLRNRNVNQPAFLFLNQLSSLGIRNNSPGGSIAFSLSSEEVGRFAFNSITFNKTVFGTGNFICGNAQFFGGYDTNNIINGWFSPCWSDNRTYLNYALSGFDIRGPGGSNTTSRMFFTPSGNVGIGTTVPNQKLTVVGDISATGTVYGSNILNRYVQNIGNNSASVFTVTHNLGTRDVITSVYDNSTYENIITSIANTTTNTVSLSFNNIPATNAYRVVVIG
jgi:hypothetical protein